MDTPKTALNIVGILSDFRLNLKIEDIIERIEF